MNAFDSDVLIYAAVEGHSLGRRVIPLFAGGTAVVDSDGIVGIGSVLLLPEVLSKPQRENAGDEYDALTDLLAHLDLRPTDDATAKIATVFGARYRLRAADAVHLATAVIGGADSFVTNNQRHFPKTITEIDIVYPEDLPEPGS